MGQAGEIRRNRSVRTADHLDAEPSGPKRDHLGLVQANTGLCQEGEGPWQTQEDNSNC